MTFLLLGFCRDTECHRAVTGKTLLNLSGGVGKVVGNRLLTCRCYIGVKCNIINPIVKNVDHAYTIGASRSAYWKGSVRLG